MNVRDRRALILGAAVVVVAVVSLRLGPMAYRALAAARDEGQSRRERLVRFRVAIGETKALEDSAEVIRARIVGLAPHILTGDRHSTAAADLIQRIAVSAAHHGVRVVRSELLVDSSRAGDLRRVSTEFSLESDTPGLMGLLAALSMDNAGVDVKELRIHAADPSAPAAVPEVLTSELVANGWFLPRDTTKS